MKSFRIVSLSAALLALSGVSTSASAVTFGAFSDVRLESSSQPGENTHFKLGGFDLYANQKIGESTSAFVETVFEDGGSGFGLDVERLFIKREIDPLFSIAAGRFHAPLGYWNRHYHHGVLLQDTPDRPQFLEFEDGDGAIMPMHAIGLMATGDAVSRAGTFSYEFNIANSSFLNTMDSANASKSGSGLEIGIGDVNDFSASKNYFLRATFKPRVLPVEVSLFGASIRYLESSDVGGDSNFGSLSKGSVLVKQTVTGFDVHYEQHPFDATAEFFHLKDDSSVGNGSDSANAFYAQIGWQFMRRLKAVYRIEELDANPNKDTYFQILNTPNYVHNVVGLRYDLDDSNSLMFQVKKVNVQGAKNYTVFTLDWAFLML